MSALAKMMYSTFACVGKRDEVMGEGERKATVNKTRLRPMMDDGPEQGGVVADHKSRRVTQLTRLSRNVTHLGFNLSSLSSGSTTGGQRANGKLMKACFSKPALYLEHKF